MSKSLKQAMRNCMTAQRQLKSAIIIGFFLKTHFYLKNMPFTCLFSISKGTKKCFYIRKKGALFLISVSSIRWILLLILKETVFDYSIDLNNSDLWKLSGEC